MRPAAETAVASRKRICADRLAVGGLVCALLAAAAAAWAPAALAQGQPAVRSPFVLDGPSPAIEASTSLGLAVARDGTGGLVYLKSAGGAEHVFVSVLTGGAFAAPVQVDAGLAGPSSQPVIEAGSGGMLLVAFVNGGVLYTAEQKPGTAGLTAPAALIAGASNPAISMTYLGKAYLAFTVADGNGQDVRAAYFDNGTWSLESAPLNVSPGDDAGSGTGRPAVVAAGDGVGIVAWGEAGGVYTRRVWATAPSVIDERADGSLPGCSETSADSPVIGAGGDSSYAQVAFHEQLSCGAASSSRVLVNRLHTSAYDGINQADGLSTVADGATEPRIAIGEYDQGIVTSQRIGAHDLMATQIENSGALDAPFAVNGEANATAPADVPAFAGLYSTLVAWQHDPGPAGPPDIRVRYAPGHEPLGPELLLSSPTQGPADAAAGLGAEGDSQGNAAVAWVQGAPGALAIVVAQLYQPPGGFPPLTRRQYSRVAQPTLSWLAPREDWGPLTYTLSVDGTALTQTEATSVQVPRALADGPHVYSLVATNPGGLQSQSGTGGVFVDTIAPTASLRLSRSRTLGEHLEARMSYRDLPPAGSPPSDASGVSSVELGWGDGTYLTIAPGIHTSSHVYRRAGRYTVALVVTDRAGNATRIAERVKIVKPKPKPKPKPGKKS